MQNAHAKATRTKGLCRASNRIGMERDLKYQNRTSEDSSLPDNREEMVALKAAKEKTGRGTFSLMTATATGKKKGQRRLYFSVGRSQGSKRKNAKELLRVATATAGPKAAVRGKKKKRASKNQTLGRIKKQKKQLKKAAKEGGGRRERRFRRRGYPQA